MTYDLRTEPWIPWRRRSGDVEWGPPSTLVSCLVDDPVVAIAAPRPDFDGALQEFLIGLLSAALQPADETAWKAAWKSPPSTEELQAALDALPDAFDLDGEGPRFFQDLSEAECRSGEVWSVESLLLSSPGTKHRDVSKREFTTELFVKPGGVVRLSRSSAAMALLTFQSYATEGGRGHLTSMRGGGPLTTLVDPRTDSHGDVLAHERPLWQKLWANVETLAQSASRAPAANPMRLDTAFPWLAPTRTSDPPTKRITTPAEVHPLQAYFGLPRRVRLETDAAGACDLTGRTDSRTVTAFWMKTYGTDYEGWQHPLSPYYRQTAAGAWLPEHGRAAGIAWRDWVGLTVISPTTDHRPAGVVAAFGKRARVLGLRTYGVHAFGFATKKNKTLAWTDAVLPTFVVDDEERRRLLYSSAVSLTEATSMTGSALLGAVKSALFQSPDDATGDLGQVKLDLWGATERAFYAAIEAVARPSLDADAAIAAADEHRRSFAPVLVSEGIRVFDRWCPAEGLGPEALRRRVAARYNLLSALRGYSKLGESIFQALGIAPPGGGRAGRAAKSRKNKEHST